MKTKIFLIFIKVHFQCFLRIRKTAVSWLTEKQEMEERPHNAFIFYLKTDSRKKKKRKTEEKHSPFSQPDHIGSKIEN